MNIAFCGKSWYHYFTVIYAINSTVKENCILLLPEILAALLALWLVYNFYYSNDYFHDFLYGKGEG